MEALTVCSTSSLPQFLQQVEGPMILQRMVEHLQADGFQRRPVRSGIDGEGIPSGNAPLGVGGKEGSICFLESQEYQKLYPQCRKPEIPYLYSCSPRIRLR